MRVRLAAGVHGAFVLPPPAPQAGEKMIVTAGALDTHVHFICPQLIDEALASGVTTLYGGGTGPNHGTLATTCTPSPSQIQMMLQASPPTRDPQPPPPLFSVVASSTRRAPLLPTTQSRGATPTLERERLSDCTSGPVSAPEARERERVCLLV